MRVCLILIMINAFLHVSMETCAQVKPKRNVLINSVDTIKQADIAQADTIELVEVIHTGYPKNT